MADPPAADATQADVPTFHIIRGGTPTPTQAAVIAAAITHLADLEADQDTEAARPQPVPAWTRAALAEAATRITVTTPHELPPPRSAP